MQQKFPLKKRTPWLFPLIALPIALGILLQDNQWWRPGHILDLIHIIIITLYCLICFYGYRNTYLLVDQPGVTIVIEGKHVPVRWEDIQNYGPLWADGKHTQYGLLLKDPEMKIPGGSLLSEEGAIKLDIFIDQDTDRKFRDVVKDYIPVIP
jgi:hypothetical protein